MNDEIVHEINVYRGRPLEVSCLLSAKARIFVLEMAENDDLSLTPDNGVSAKGHFRPWEIVKAWIYSDQHRVLIDRKLTRVGVATCELNGVRYWCVLTK
jgi:hypothetical protein